MPTQGYRESVESIPARYLFHKFFPSPSFKASIKMIAFAPRAWDTASRVPKNSSLVQDGLNRRIICDQGSSLSLNCPPNSNTVGRPSCTLCLATSQNKCVFPIPASPTSKSAGTLDKRASLLSVKSPSSLSSPVSSNKW